MRLPFNLQLMSLIVGALFALFIYPRILAMLGNVGSSKAA